MIDFETWFSQIVTTCELVASEDALPRTWVGGERSVTSIIDFGELYEQVFGDLDSEACLAKFASAMGTQTRLTVDTFLSSIKKLDSVAGNDPDLNKPAKLLASVAWREVKEAAMAVIEMPTARKYRSGRDDIRI